MSPNAADAEALKSLDARIGDAKIDYDSAVDHLTHVADLVKINQTTPGQMDEASTRMEAARKTLDDLREERDRLVEQMQAPAAGSWTNLTGTKADEGSLDTGHYDDGHSFGWKQPAQPQSAVAPPPLTETPAAPATPPPPADTKTGFNWKVGIGAGLAVALIAVVAIVALAGGGDSSPKTEPVAATDSSADSVVPSSEVAAGGGGPVRYQSNCQGACFMVVDAASCDRTFTFDLTLLGEDVAKFEGKTAVISTVGPGLLPTYNAPVAKGKVELSVLATGASYGGDPKRGCGVNGVTLQWTGLLTSVDGQPTITPNPPQAAN